MSFSTLLLAFLLVGDSFPNSTPYPYDTFGGMKAPIYTSAIGEASHFLNLLDQKAYGGAYSDAGALLKDVINQEEWIGAMERVRSRFGYMVTRKVSSHNTMETLPFGTKGYFIIFTFDSTFTANAHASEKVILMRTDRDNFRVISYSISGK